MADALQVNSPIRPTVGKTMTRDSSSLTKNETRVEEPLPSQNTNPQPEKDDPLVFFKIFSKYTNLGAAILNFAYGAIGQFVDFGKYEKSIDSVCTLATKLGTSSQGLMKASQAYKKKNAIAMFGSSLEPLVALCSNGYNLWLSRGFAQGLSQFDAVASRIFKPNQEHIPEKERAKYEDFKEEGWLEGIKITTKESGRLIKELVTNPKDSKERTSQLISLFSIFQAGGSVLAFLGLEKIGATMRDFGGGTVDIAFMTDEKQEDGKNTPLFWSGVKWLGSAFFDYAKRFSFFNFIKNSTAFSLCLDRWAAVDYILDGERKVKGEEKAQTD